MSNPPNTLISEAESSVQRVIRICRRRQRWQKFFNPTTQTSAAANTPNWRIQVADLLESGKAHFITVILLSIDIAVSVTELISSPPLCKGKSRSDHESEEPWYHWLGVAVLAVLVVKSTLMLVGLGWSFFKRGGVVIDAVVAVTALVLELSVKSMRDGGGLIAVVSLWRVVRVFESAFELSDKAIEDHIERVLAELDAIKLAGGSSDLHEELGP